MDKVKSLLLRTDFLGPTIGFEYNGHKNFQSLQGSFYSLIVISITAIICFMFGQEIYLRKSPNTYYSQDVVEESSINLHDFPIFFGIVDGYGNNVKNLGQTLQWDVVEFAISPNATINRTVYELKLKPCNFSSFEDRFLSILKKSYVHSTIDFLCFDDSRYYFKNPYATVDSTYLNFRFKVCDSSTTNCLPGVESLLSNIFIDMFYFDSYIDSTNYTTPVQYIDYSITSQLSPGLLKRNMLRVVNNILNADSGWILEDVAVIPYISLFNYVSLFDLVDPNGAYPLDRLWITFESPKLRNNNFRNYLKIQALLASIGGISQFLLIVIQIISQHHLYFLYLCFIKKFANEEIEYQLNSKKIDKDVAIKENEINFSKLSGADLNNSNAELINQIKVQNQKVITEIKKVEMVKINLENFGKSNHTPINNTPANDLSSYNQIKVNNFITKSKTVTEFYSHHLDQFSYYDYIKAYICFDNKNKIKYEKSLTTIQKLIGIKLFSRLMINVHHKTNET